MMSRTQWYIGAPNGVVVCVRENNDGELKGEFYHSYSSKPVEKTGERKKVMSDEMLLTKHGEIGTFIVRVQHRQNSSWQGRITWMEEDKTIQFRSVWEMIKLIESAVNSISESEEEEPEENWFSAEAVQGED